MIDPPTPEYLDQLRHTHEGHLRVRLYSEGILVGELPTSGINMTIDGRAEIWRTARIAVGVDFWETETRAVLEEVNVQTGEVTIEHGIRWTPQDVIHWVQLARLRVDQLSMTLLSGARQITAYDRALLLAEHNLPTARPLNDTYVNLITTLLDETLPGEPLYIAPEIDTALEPAPGKSLALGTSRLTEMIRFAQALNGFFRNDELGGFRIGYLDPDAAPVWSVNDGDEGVIVNMTQEFARAEQFNAVGIEYSPDAGSDDDWMLYIYAWDNDPLSPTFYDGPFGKRNIFFSEEYDHLPTDAEAEALARRKLSEYTGATRGLAITSAYNPLLQPGDTIEVTFPETETVENHIVEAIHLNLGNSAQMNVETRLKRDPAEFATAFNALPGAEA